MQERLVLALRAPDPARALRALADDAELTPDERLALAALDPDALRVTRRIVRKLRLQRLAADPELRAAMDRDPDGFRERFRAYDATVPPTSLFAEDEARAFRRYAADSGAP